MSSHLAPPLLSPPPLASTSSSTSSTAPTTLGRARSGSRTFSEAQAALLAEQFDDSQRARREASEDSDGGVGVEEITPGELRAEMETLLSLRRRSLSQPATVDPDLPPPTSPTSPHSPRPSLTVQVTAPLHNAPSGAPVSPTAPTAAETGTLVRRRSSVSTRLPSDHPLPSPPLPSPTGSAFNVGGTGDGAAAAHTSQDLFWLPASLHPELAPQEFKAFIREQTRPDNLARRTSNSGRGGRVDRKKSMLRGEYKPSSNDGVGEGEREARLSRTTSDGGQGSGRRLNFDELTISDLQRLEELAARAESEGATDGEGEGERLGRVLRRSLSLNPNLVAAAAAQGSYLPQTADTSDDATSPVDSPLIVHSPGQILRRSARTKIRKVGLAGDGGGHRFGPSRRTRTVSGDQSLLDDADTAGDASTDSIESDELRSGDKSSAEALLDDSVASSPSSDAHATDIQYFENVKLPVLDRDTAVSVEDGSWSEHTSSTNDKEVLPAPPPSSLATANLDAPLPPTPVPQRPPLSSPPQLGPSTISPASAEYDWATHQLQQQQPPPSLPPSPAPYPERKDSVHTPPPSLPSLAVQPPALSSSTPSASSSRSSSISEKKKSGWARLGLGVRSSDDDAKKGKKGKGKEGGMSHVVEAAVAKQQAVDREKEREAAQQQAKDKDKESGFFGGLFGKRKSDHEPIPPPERVPSPPEPRIPPPPPTASGQLMPNGTYINFYRLPIHVERAVYRLSHIKLANPRRPLYEQVLISNLMFWYLATINKPVAPAPTPAPIPMPQSRADEQAAASSGSSTSPAPSQSEPRPKEKRGSLNKGSGGSGRPGGARSSERPIKQPQYEQQNRQIDQEYSTSHHQQQHSQTPQAYPQQPHHSSSHSHQQQFSSSPIPVVVTTPSSPSPPQASNSRSPDRSSAPADLYAASSHIPPDEGDSEEDDEDNRPLQASVTHRESYPPHRPPVSVSSYLKHDSGFEVTSRSGRLSDTGPGAASSNDFASNVNRRTSDVSTKSFDASEIIDAYGAVSPGSSPVLAQTPLPPASASDALNLDPSTALFGNVAPRAEQTARRARADSLPRGGTGDGNGGAALTKARSKSPPLGLGLGHATMVGSSSKRSVSGSASVGGVREYR